MVETTEINHENPICPHCKIEVKNLWYQQISSFLGKRFVYFCSNCKSVLGISHRKGFWMG